MCVRTVASGLCLPQRKKGVTICMYLFILVYFAQAYAEGLKLSDPCRVFLNTLKCHGNLTENFKFSAIITELKLSDLTTKKLDLNFIIERYPKLKSIVVENSTVTTVIPPEIDNVVEELVLNNLAIKRIHKNFVLFFPVLKVLQLKRNLLSGISDRFNVSNLQELYIEHNPWNCSKDLSWALMLNKTNIVRDLLTTTCKDTPYSEINVLLVAAYKKNTQDNCIKTCECSLEYIASDPKTNERYPIIMMNCSGRGFTDLPNHLPLNTRILHLENNMISDIKSLKTNSCFRQLWDLYLDNNTIDSISYLEGSYWLSNFRIFSLKGNKLEKLPAFALDNALMKNPYMPNGVRLFLGGNPWKCDCSFIPVFQELVLQKYSSRVDVKDIKCSYVKGDENSLKSINNLSRSSVCMVPSDFSLQEGLDLLNAVLASLIVFILGKLAYDYYHFKKSGKLPWIVSKMP